MTKNSLFALIIIFMVFISGCSNKVETVSKSKKRDLLISNYFPEVGTVNTYILDPEGERIESKAYVKSEKDSKGREQLYIQELGGLGGEKYTQYEVNRESIRIVYVKNALLNESTNVLELTNKQRWETQDGDNSISYLTKTGIKVEVEAGVFNDCLEVTNVTKTKDQKYIAKKYYAPKVGLIKTVVVSRDKKDVLSELKKTSVSQSNSVTKEMEEPVNDVEEINRDVNEANKINLNLKDNVYKNAKYGFSFQYPLEWNDFLYIEEGNWEVSAEKTIDFHYKLDNIKEFVFAITILDGELLEENWEYPIWTYIDANNGKTFGYVTPGELSIEVLEDEEKLNTTQNIIKELPVIMQTFKFD